MADGPKLYPIVQLFTALEAEGIRFMLVGMTAANLQGVLAATIDVDVWIGLPSRQYMRVINLCRNFGAGLRSPNKVFLSDDTPVDFIYEVTGLLSFEQEYRRALWLPFHGIKLPVLPLERICKSKKAAGREKDELHILLIRQLLQARRKARKSRNHANPVSRRRRSKSRG